MEKYRINGGLPLYGAVDISGAKNAVVAILPAVILSDEPCRIENIPNINDVSTSLRILRSLGAEVNRLDRHTVQIDPRPICTDRVDYELRAPCGHRIILSAHCWASAGQRPRTHAGRLLVWRTADRPAPEGLPCSGGTGAADGAGDH